MTAHGDLEMFRGESAQWDLYFTNLDGTAKLLTGVLVELVVQQLPDESVIALTRSTAVGGVTISDQATAKGHATLSLVPADTSTLPLRGYSYKARTTDADGFVSVGRYGFFTLKHE